MFAGEVGLGAVGRVLEFSMTLPQQAQLAMDTALAGPLFADFGYRPEGRPFASFQRVSRRPDWTHQPV